MGLGFFTIIPANIIRIFLLLPASSDSLKDDYKNLRQSNLASLYWIILAYGASFLFMLVNYFLTKKYKIFGQLFSLLQTINLVVSLTEISLIFSSASSDYIDYTGRVQCVLLGTLSLCSYNQAYMLVIYLLAAVYFGVRSSIGIANSVTLLNFLVYQCLGLAFLFMLSRCNDGY